MQTTIFEAKALAVAHYENLRSRNLVSGWEKYVLTNGNECLFVDSNYLPQKGEYLFYCTTRNGLTLCELK
jgi:hypothetical protein